MPKPQTPETELHETAPSGEHKPQQYSTAQHLSTTVKVIGAAILLGGLLWLLDLAVSK